MNTLNIENWNKTYAECSQLSKDIAALTRFREFTASDVALAPPSAAQCKLASNWIAAIEVILIMVDHVKSQSPVGTDTCGMDEDLEVCRDVLLEVRAQLQNLAGTTEFESLRHCMAVEAARACT